MEPVKAAIYLRLSLDKNGDGLGVERQREDANVIIATRGWTAVGEYVDNNITASTWSWSRSNFWSRRSNNEIN